MWQRRKPKQYLTKVEQLVGASIGKRTWAVPFLYLCLCHTPAFLLFSWNIPVTTHLLLWKSNTEKQKEKWLLRNFQNPKGWSVKNQAMENFKTRKSSCRHAVKCNILRSSGRRVSQKGARGHLISPGCSVLPPLCLPWYPPTNNKCFNSFASFCLLVSWQNANIHILLQRSWPMGSCPKAVHVPGV